MDLIPSKQLSCEIKEFIEDYDKLLIVGIGNILRGDDGLGPLFIDVVYDKLTKTTKNTDNIFPPTIYIRLAMIISSVNASRSLDFSMLDK